MKAVWLPSNYWHDPALSSLHRDCETLFTRAWAHCGLAETKGFIPKSALKTFGIRSVSRRVSDLVSVGILHETEAEISGSIIPGYQFADWAQWNQKGDDLLERQKNDRERQARLRARKSGKKANESRDTSRDVTPPEQTREEKNTTYVPSAAHVSNAHTHDETRRAPADEATGPTVPPDGWKIVRNLTQGLSQPTRTALAIQAAAMLHAGVDATDITTGLETWMSRPDARIGLFRHLVDDAVKARRAPTAAANTGVPVAHHDRKTLGWEEAAEAAKRSLGLIPGDNQPALPAPGDRPLLTILDSDYVQEIA